MGYKQHELVAALLRELAKKVESIRYEDIEDVLTGRSRLEIKITPVGGAPVKLKKPTLSKDELEKVSEALHLMSSREEGENYLKEHFATRDGLIQLAKIIDIATQKKDTTDQVIQRIIEGTIGFRLRSAAIQGNNSH